MTTTPEKIAEAIPNRFDFAAAEQIYVNWEQAGCFDAEVDPHKQPYTIVIPPPNVTGALHLGHGLNNTLQDIIIRFKRMQGYATLWMPGTDHAGIATQAVVERRLKEDENKTRHDLGREALVQRIWQWKDQYEARILRQLKRMGCSCDWRRTRFTLDSQCAEAVRVTFFDLFRKRLIYRGKRLVNWDTFLQTAVSDDEVFNETVRGHFYHIRYRVIDPQPGEPLTLEIATTRPETLLGDTAVAVHPDPAGAFAGLEQELVERLQTVAAKDRRALQDQLDDVRQRQREMLPQLELLRQMAAQGRKLMLPLLNRPIPLVVDHWAKPEMGTGCVKITPAHDPNDYEVGLRQQLPMINILNPDGTLNEAAGQYAGLSISAARKQVVADLKGIGLLGEVEDRDIELPHSDRSKMPIEPYLADQWFVKMDKLAQSAMDAVTSGEVQITPPRYGKGYLDWLSEKRDWPVSRQLWWGHRIPIWSAELPTGSQAEAWLSQLKRFVAAASEAICYQVDKDQVFVCLREANEGWEQELQKLGLVQDPDVLDTWFSSALWPHSTLGWPGKTEELNYFYPTSTLMTSRDIISLWVARMVLMGLNNLGQVPFREVYIHPAILDGNGERMSKSKGNGVDPSEIIDKFGPDALRFGLARLATETQDVRLPVQYECPHCGKLIDQTPKNRSLPRIKCTACKQEFSTQWAESQADLDLVRGAMISERFEIARNFVNKLWNASRFVLMHLSGFQQQTLEIQRLNVEDRWLLSRLATVTRDASDNLQRFHFAEAARLLYDFAWEDYCSFYIEIAKPRLNDPQQRSKVQNVLAHVLDQLLRLLHPFVPFVTEAIWQHLGAVAPLRGIGEQAEPAAQFVMLAAWPPADLSQLDPRIEDQFSQFQAVLGAIREIRSRQNIAPKEEVCFAVRCSQTVTELLQPMEGYFLALARAKAIQWGDSQPFATGVQVNLPAFDVDVYLDLEKFIDVEAERQRLATLMEKLKKQISGKQAKLENPQFVARAPQAVVQQERNSLQQLVSQLDETNQLLGKLSALSK